MAQPISGLTIGLGLDTTGIDQGMKQLRSKLSLVNSEMKANMSAFDRGERSVGKYETQISTLNRKLDVQKAAVAETRREYEKMVQQHGEGSRQAEHAARAYNNQVAALNNTERSVERLAEELRQLQEQQRVTESGMYRFGQSMQDVGGRMTKIGDGMKNVGKSMSMYVTAPLTAIGVGAFKAAVDFETAFAGVRKTVDTSEVGFKILEEGIRNMAKELPVTANDIAEVAESAGQLGIAEENILGFTKTIIDLGESTNLTREQAATEFARFANIVGMPQTSFDRLGSSVVSLGNNLATTEAEIVSMGMRLAGTGAQVGLTEAEIMALAASMSSVGIEAEAGGTAMSTVMKKIQNAVSAGGGELEIFAKAANMSTKDFADAFENRPIEAIDAFIKGLAKSSGEGENLNGILEDLGIKGIRESDTLLRLAGASDILSTAVGLSSTAWEENTALSNEAEQRYETMASKLQVLKNQFIDVAIDFGNVIAPEVMKLADKVQGLIGWFGALPDSAKKAVVGFGVVAAAIGPVLVVAGTLMSALGSVITFVGSAATAISIMGTGVAAATPLIGGLATAFTILTGPVGLTIAALAGLTAGGIALANYLSKDAIESVDIFGEGIEGVSESTTVALGAFWDLGDGIDEALMDMRVNGDVLTKEYADTIFGNFRTMNEQILGSMNENYEEQRRVMLESFEGTRYLTDEERKKILNQMDTHHAIQTEKQQQQLNRINEIEQKALAENRELTETELVEINGIRTAMENAAIETLSESAAEQAAIRQRLKDTAGEISANQAADLIGKAAKVRDETIAAAETEYDDKIAIYTNMKDNLGTLTQEQYETLVQKAKDQRDDTVTEAEGMYDDIYDETIASNKELNGVIDKDTGEKLSKWDVYKNGVIQRFKETNENSLADFKRWGKNMKDWTDDVVTNTKEKWSAYKTAIVGFFKTMGTDALKYVAEIVKGSGEMPGKMAKGISNAAGAATSAVVAMGNDMLRKFGGVVNALISGVNSITSKLGIKANISLWSVPTIPGGGSGRSSARPVAAYHAGTDGHPGGPMIVGDRHGRELVQFPNGKMWMSPDTDTLVPNAPKGTRVIPNKLTEKLVKGEIPMYAKGIGVIDAIRGIATGGAKAASWLSNVWDYASNPKKLIDLMVSRLGLSITGLSGGMADLAKGAFGTVKDKSIDYIKEMFKKAGDVTGGSFGPGFRLTSRAGWRIHPIYGDRRFHYGDDWGAAAGTNIKSMSSGIVKSARREGARGNTVRVQSGPYELIYQHNSRNNVRGGQSVTKGQSIGAVGSTGDSTGPHLHFETWKNGSFVHPKSLGFKTGAVFNGPTAGLMAEDGHPEVLIPTDPKRRTDAMKLLAVVGKMLGADGGNATRPNQLPPLPGGQGNSVLEELLAATLNQNQILMQLLNKNSDVYLDTGVLAGAMTPEVSRNQGSSYELNRLMRGR